MKKSYLTKKCLSGLVATCIVASASIACADAFTNYPGTKARGMGGAFTAVADDASAVWYNPAGLVENGTTNVTIEGGNTISIEADSNEGFTDNKFTGFASAAFVGERWATSVFYYNPYRPAAYLRNYGIQQDINGFLDQTTHIGGLGASYKLLESEDPGFFTDLSVGGTLELVKMNAQDSRLYQNGVPIDQDDMSKTSFSGSLGVLATLLNTQTDSGNQDWRVNVGFTYRFDTSSDIFTDQDNTTSSIVKYSVLRGKPESWDLGLAVSKNFSFLASRLTTSVQYGSTDYGTRIEDKDWAYQDYTQGDFQYDKWAVGVEYQMNSSDWGLLTQIAVRAGYNNASHSENGDSFYPETVKSYTAGLSFGLGEHVNFDVAYERRSWEFDPIFGEEDQDFDLFLGAFKYFF